MSASLRTNASAWPRRGAVVSSLIFVLALGLGPLAQAQVPATGFVIDQLHVGSDLNAVVDFAQLADGRFLILKTNGELKLWVGATATMTTIGSFAAPAYSSFTSIAADPAFGTNGRIYVRFAAFDAALGHDTHRIVRDVLVGDLADAVSSNLAFAAASQHVILDGVPGGHVIHNATGTIRFGVDGMLYAGFAVASSDYEAADRTSLPGVLTRLDLSNLPSGPGGPPSRALLAPADNPFVGSIDLEERLVIAWGLSSIRTFVPDPLSASLAIQDGGTGYQREEFDHFSRDLSLPPSPVDFGFPYFDGTSPTGVPGTPPPGPVGPLAQYAPGWHGAVPMVAGGIYRNLGGLLDWGPAYEGNAFYAKTTGELYRIVPDPLTAAWPPPNATTQVVNPWSGIPIHVRRIERGHDGSMYFVALGQFGRIRSQAATPIVTMVSGSAQVGVIGQPFAQPFTAQVHDVAGNPVAGVYVHFRSTGQGFSANPPGAYTDANGLASTIVTPTGNGATSVTPIAFGMPHPAATTAVFTRGLNVMKLPSGAFMSLVNTTNGTAPVPFLFAITLDSVPVLPTPFGPLGISIFDGNGTVVIEDPFCVYGCSVTQGGFGTPSKTAFYAVPPWLTGTFRFQAIVVDPTVITSVAGVQPSIIGLTNIVTLTF